MTRCVHLLFTLFVGSCFPLAAQTGPGGVGNAAANSLWLRADVLSLAGGVAVPVWPDASGNGNHAARALAAEQPVYLASSTLNGRPAVRFDGVDDQLIVPDATQLDGGSGITYFAVVRPHNVSSEPLGILGKRITYTVDNDYAYAWFFYNGGQISLDVNDDSNRFSSTVSFKNEVNYLLGWDFDGTRSSTTRARLYSGSTVVGTGSNPQTTINQSAEGVVLGGLNRDYRTRLSADYAEVIHFNRILTALERRVVINYLSGKYNIPLTSEDVYRQDDPANGNYDHDIAGIGRVSAGDRQTAARGTGILTLGNPTGLGNNEYLFWGHDGANLPLNETSDLPVGMESRSGRTWRVSEVNLSGAAVEVGAVDLTFELESLGGGIDAERLRLLVDTDGDGSFADETPVGGAIAGGSEGTSYTFAAVTALTDASRFTLGQATAATALPIRLLSFTARADHRGVDLEWTTTEERDNDYVDLERSADGRAWTVIYRAEGGESTFSERRYSYTDTAARRGRNYYRLRQVDYDQTRTYSAVVLVDTEAFLPGLSAHPNPVTGPLAVRAPRVDLRDLRIYDLAGRDRSAEVRGMGPAAAGEGERLLDVSSLPRGVYLLSSGDGGGGVVRVVKR